MPTLATLAASLLPLLPLLQAPSYSLAPNAESADSPVLDIAVDVAQPPDGVSAHDWAGIREAYEASRHAIVTTDEGFAARSPRNGWVAYFDGQGFMLAPDASDWCFGLELERFGVAGSVRALDAPQRVCTDGQRLTYDWNADVSEWWVNDALGLEHGFTVHHPPAAETEGCDATLLFDLAVRGALVPSVTADRLGARLVDASHAVVSTYDGLVAFDANGTPLGAWLEADQGRMRIHVRADDARYPITVDPVVQTAYLKASNTGAGDHFGISVAIDGGTVVVGAYLEDSNATGVNGNQADNSAPDSGAAYVFVRSGATWVQEAYLKASNTGALDRFGLAVAISGDTVVVGADFEDSNATGVNGNQADNSAPDSGAAYLFVRTGTNWSPWAYVKASNTGADDRFGQAVAIDGDIVVVGAYLEDSSATGVNGNQVDNGAPGSGAAYVFVRSGATWSQEAYLKASNTGGGDDFAWSVAVAGDTVAVAGYGEDSNATGVNGDQTDDSAQDSGAVYVYVRTGTAWSQQAYVKASNTETGDLFGSFVAIAGDDLVVSAYGEDSNATGANGNQADNSALTSGAAYVFVRAGATWSQQAYLKASNTEADDRLGWSIDIAADTLVVGALTESSDATGVNGDQANNNATWSGAAYVFVRTGVTWSQQAYLKASNTGANDVFGCSVAIAGDTVVIGAVFEGSNATGVNGNQANNSATNAGAAYLFDLIAPGTIGTNFCHPFNLNSSNLAATITVTGSTVRANNDVVLTVTGLPTTGMTAMLFNSMNASTTIYVPILGGVASAGRICIGGGHFGRHIEDLYSGTAGSFARRLDLDALPYPEAPGDYSISVLAGQTWFWQCWYRDPALGVNRSNFSDAVAITFG